MENKDRLPITKGDWRTNQLGNGDIVINSDSWKKFIAVEFTHPYKNTEQTRNECLANAQLIADAGTTYNKVGLLPSTLAHQKQDLIEMLQICLKDYETKIPQSAARDSRMDDIESLINKHS